MTLHNIGVSHDCEGRLKEAAIAYGKSLALRPNSTFPTARYLEQLLQAGPSVRICAIEGLRQYDEERALTLCLEDAASTLPEVRLNAVKELRKFEDPRAVQGLTRTLTDTDKTIVTEAMIGLAAIGDETVVPTLQPLWSHPSPEVRIELGKTLQGLHQKTGKSEPLVSLTSGLVDIAPRVQSQTLQMMRDLAPSPQAVPVYLTMLDQGNDAASLARSKVRKLGIAAAQPLREALEHPDPLVRAAVPGILAEVAPQQFVAAAPDIFERAHDPQVRVAALRAMVDLPRVSEETKWPVLKLAAGDSDPLLRKTAAELTQKLGTKAKMQLLSPMVTKDPDATVRQVAIDVLGTVDTREAISAIIPGLADSNVAVRETTRKALQRNSETAIPSLGSLLKRPTEGIEIKLEAMKFLAESESPLAIKPLTEAVKSPETRVRAVALKGLARFDEPEAIAPIIEVLSQEHTPTEAVDALSLVTSSRVLPKLVEAVLSPRTPKPNTDLLKRKIADIGQIRADQPVESVVGSVLKNSSIDKRIRLEVKGSVDVMRGKSDTGLDTWLATLQDPVVQREFGEAVGRLDPGEFPKIERRLLDTTAHSAVRVGAARALGQSGGLDQLQVLAKGLVIEPNPEVRRERIQAIGNLGQISTQKIVKSKAASMLLDLSESDQAAAAKEAKLVLRESRLLTD